MAQRSDILAARTFVAAACRQLAEQGLFIGTAGNLSMRVGDLVAVTATGLVLAQATPDDISVVDASGTVVEGELAPTSEVDLHLDVLAHHRAGAVVHTHAPWGTALSLVLDELPCVHYQQLVLGGAVPVVPFAVFGSPELAASVDAALTGRQAVLLANHGTVTTGADLATAVQNAVLLEWVCALYARARGVGEPRALTPADQQAVVVAATARGYGRTHKAAQA
jgi:L-fuculose-phosphate aldolase